MSYDTTAVETIKGDFPMKPLILITNKPRPDDFSVGGICYTPANYCNAIIKAGGIPVIAALADADEYAELADGIIFTGSNCDITPSLYGQENRKSVFCSETLDEMELQLFRAFSERNKPIFGICRGVQLINVALGGTLIQDISDEVPGLTVHEKVCKEETQFHYVNAKEGSLFGQFFGTGFLTNSYHHQAIKDCGKGLIPTVTTEDGIIEAVEHESRPIFGAQWHPERMIGQEQLELTDMIPIFRYFVDLCRK